ncbi:MAG: response regulator transcription factor [Nitriliruptorales bacterium]
MVHVLVVDDQPLVRVGVARILGLEDDIEIVGECEDGDEVIEAVERLRPDVVLMDVRMKRVDGTTATQLLLQRDDAPAVLVLTTFGEDEVVAAALDSGAAGFVLKDAPGEELVRAIRVVADGGAWLDPAVTGGVIDRFRETALPRGAAAAKLEELTEREREVLRLVGRGLTNQEIAARLHITEATVKTHVTHIFTKLDLRDRAAAIVLAFDHGLVSPGDASVG